MGIIVIALLPMWRVLGHFLRPTTLLLSFLRFTQRNNYREQCFIEREWDDEGGHDGDDDDKDEDDGNEEGNEEEAFPFACVGAEESTISADGAFHNGQIKRIFPLFDRSLLLSFSGSRFGTGEGRFAPSASSEQEQKFCRWYSVNGYQIKAWKLSTARLARCDEHLQCKWHHCPSTTVCDFICCCKISRLCSPDCRSASVQHPSMMPTSKPSVSHINCQVSAHRLQIKLL